MLEGLQRARIIHTDIKPDNFLVTWPPTLFDDAPAATRPPAWAPAVAAAKDGPWRAGCLQLIDFGRAIDLELLRAGVQFTGAALTEGMQCPEMLAGKPWHFCVRSHFFVTCVCSLRIGWCFGGVGRGAAVAQESLAARTVSSHHA